MTKTDIKPMLGKMLEFRWSTSRERETSGWLVCSLYVGNHKVAVSTGGNCSLEGEALGEWIQGTFLQDLTTLNASEVTGLTFYNTKTREYQDTYTGPHVGISVDGAVGFSAMIRLLNRFDLDLMEHRRSETRWTYEFIKYGEIPF